MNIFVLDTEPKLAAISQCNRHIIKMPLESAQMLCSAFNPGEAPYKRSYYNHPCTIWSRTSKDNYLWLIEHSFALCDEYSLRYRKVHASKSIITFCKNNINKLVFPKIGLTEFAQAMPDNFKDINSVIAYRNYYLNAKQHLFTRKSKQGQILEWKLPSEPPDWIANNLSKGLMRC